jgi:ribosome-binding factor A
LNEIRKKKIEREIQKTIATLINTEKVKDPRVTMATIHRVDLASDMSQAIVYYTAICSNNERKKLSQGLVSAGGFLQSMIGKKLGLRHTPRLQFVWDNNYIKSIEVNRLIDESAPKQPISDEIEEDEEESSEFPGDEVDE